MKKLNSIKYAVLAFAFVLTLTSCEKEAENEQVALGKATISGKVKIDLDWSDSNGAATSTLLSGKKLYAKYNTKDLVINPGSGTFGYVILTTTIGADGTYSFTIPTNPNIGSTVSVTIYSDELELQYKDGGGDTDFRVYYISGSTETVVNGQSKVLDVTFN